MFEANDFESLAAALEQTPDMDLVLLDLSMPACAASPACCSCAPSGPACR